MNTIDITKRVQEVLNRGYLMSLGVQDAAGVWVSDVAYTSDDNLVIYWKSDPNSRHSQAILKNGHVAGTITVSNKSGQEVHPYLSSHTAKIRKPLAFRRYLKDETPCEVEP